MHNQLHQKWKVGWGVTPLCNMSCDFCYSRHSREKTAEPSFEQYCSFLSKNAKQIDSINYGTGENTLSGKWLSLLTHVRETYPGIKQALTTNGYLSDIIQKDQYAELLLGAIDEIDISIDFAEPEKHNRFRGNEHAYGWAVETLRICQKEGLPATIVVLGIDDTLRKSNLEALFNLARRYNAYLRINIFRPNAGQRIPPLNYDVLKKTLCWILDRYAVVSLADPLISALLLKRISNDSSGLSSLRILPDGSITPSTYLVDDEWRTMTIDSCDLSEPDISNRLLGRLAEAVQVVPEACQACELAELCKGGAVDRRIIWYNTLSTPDPYCPQRHNDNTDWFTHLSGSPRMIPGPGIHDGYLPTLIFSSQKK